MPTLKIYIYTNENDRKVNQYKIGETWGCPYQRIKKQDNSSNSSPLEYVYHIEISEEELEKIYGKSNFNTSKDKPKFDDKIREEFCRLGYAKKVRKEFVRIDSSGNIEEYLQKAANSIIYDSIRPNNFSRRVEQDECVNKVVKYFSDYCVVTKHNKIPRFLIAAKMRFGKTFTSLEIIRQMNQENSESVKRVLIATYKPQTLKEFENDCENHINFKNFEFYTVSDFPKGVIDLPESDNVQIIAVSFQDLLDYGKSKWKNLLNYEFDLLILDEVHYGVDTYKCKETLEQIKYSRILELSGTPFEKLYCGDYVNENTYLWTYVDEQRKKRDEDKSGSNEIVYGIMPTMEIYYIKVGEDVENQIQQYSTEEGFTFCKLFEVDSKTSQFKDLYAVNSLINQSFGIGKMYRRGNKFREVCPKHLVIFMDRVDSVKSMIPILKKSLKNEYHIIDASGTTGINNIESLRTDISNHEKTITLSCGRFNTGTTVKEWEMAFMWTSCKSPETYFQSIFRCQSPNIEGDVYKDKCYIIDLDPQRCLKMSREYAMLIKKPEENINENQNELLDFLPIFEFNGNKFEKVSAEQVANCLSAETCLKDFSNSERLVNSQELFNSSDLEDILEYGDFKGSSFSDKKNRKVSLNDNGMDGAKNYDKSLNENGYSENKEVDSYTLLAKKIKEIISKMLEKIPNFLWNFTEDEFDNIDKILYTNNDDVKNAFYSEFNITRENFIKYIYPKINVKRVNVCIQNMNQLIKNINLDRDLDIIGKIDRCINFIQHLYGINTPKTEAEKMVSVMNINSKKSNLNILDACCGRGIFSLILVKKLLSEGVCIKKIFSDILHFNEFDENKIKSLKSTFKRLVGLDINIIDGDILETEFNMKFDYIISNPPYNGKAAMHQKIFNHCVNSLLKDEGTICFLQPDTPYTSKLPNKRLLENLKMMDNIKKYETSVEFIEPDIFETASPMTSLAITVLRKIESSRIEVKYLDGTMYDNISLEDINKLGICPKIYRSLFNKIQNYVNKNGSLKQIMFNLNKGSCDSGLKIQKVRGHVGQDDFYTLISKNEKYYDIVECDYGIYISDKEKNSLISYLKSFIFRYCLSIYKTNLNTDISKFPMTPLIPFDRIWDDQMLAKEIGISKLELDVIMEIIPDYYGLRNE